MPYSGKYRVKNKKKYNGDPSKVVYRSHWEKQVFKWCDDNKGILEWNSEEVVVPYRCKTDGKVHRYFVDLFIRTKTGIYCVEIKPKKQTVPPKKPRIKTKRYLKEVMTYVKNRSKWETAEMYCDLKGWEFQIWDEDKIKSLGIKLLCHK